LYDLELIKELAESGRYLECISACQEQLLSHPEEPYIHKKAGMACLAIGRIEEAIKHLNISYQLNNADPETIKDLGNCFKACGNNVEALRLYHLAVQIDPSYAPAINNIGLALKDIGQLENAGIFARKAVKLSPGCAPFLLNFGTILKLQQKYDDAIDCFRKAIGIDSSYAEAYMNLALAYVELGKMDEALETAIESVRLKPNHFGLNIDLAGIFQERGELEQALACTVRAIELEPQNLIGHINAGGILKEKGELDQALLFTYKAIELQPNNSIAFMNAGGILKEQGMLDHALAATLKAIELQPNNSMAHMNAGGILKEQGMLDHALSATLKAIELQPNNSMAHMNVGGILKEQGNLSEALVATLKSVELNPNSPQAYYILGTIQRAIGDIEVGDRSLNMALQLNPRETGALFELSLSIETTEAAHNLLTDATLVEKEIYSPMARARLEFTFANCFHILKNYTKAAHHLEKACNHKLQVHPSDAQVHLKRTEHYTKNLLGFPEGESEDGCKRVFVVGVPRCGSTLLESILCANPEIHGLGESHALPKAITDLESSMSTSGFINLERSYVAQLNLAQSRARLYTLDKQLYNYQLSGLILRGMPKAKIIHCQRNPMDNILSMLRSNLTAGNNYTSSALDAANILISQEMVMREMKALFPGRIFSFNYDVFVNNPSHALEPLLDWLGLPNVGDYLHPERSTKNINTASVIQARRPINNKSVGAWRNYSSLLRVAHQAILKSGLDAI
jgi:tetratricopeptide (TPR) repeat protein